MSGKTILVTGGSGFIGSHVIVHALRKGYTLRTTIRSLSTADLVREKLRAGGISEQQANTVEFFQADLLSDQGWDAACRGCDFVLHVASPFPSKTPKNEDDLIIPAREGTLRALRAAKRAGTVKRVVITSSFAAVGYGHEQRSDDNPFTEKDWTILTNPKTSFGAYEKSKTLAEEAAWKWLQDEGGSMELATVNPVLVLGPSLSSEESTSLELPRKLLNGELPGLPRLSFGVVDVRDVACLHLMVMETPGAKGNRFLAISDELAVSVKEIAMYMKEGLPVKDTKRIPTFELPNMLVRLVSIFDASVGLIVPALGIIRPTSNAKARALGWQPRSAREAVLSSAESLKLWAKRSMK